jgi:hypothetical protein
MGLKSDGILFKIVFFVFNGLWQIADFFFNPKGSPDGVNYLEILFESKIYLNLVPSPPQHHFLCFRGTGVKIRIIFGPKSSRSDVIPLDFLFESKISKFYPKSGEHRFLWVHRTWVDF